MLFDIRKCHGVKSCKLHRACHTRYKQNNGNQRRRRIFRKGRISKKRARNDKAVDHQHTAKTKAVHNPCGGWFHTQVTDKQPQEQSTGFRRTVAKAKLKGQRQ